MNARTIALCLAVILGSNVAVASDGLPELALGRNFQYDYDPPVPGSYKLPPLLPAGDGAVLREDGSAGSLRGMYRGKITVLAFIYTRCHDARACPYATRVFYQMHQVTSRDPVLAKNLQLITMSFDPSHDTPEVMASYRKLYEPERKGARWFYLTTRNAGDLKPILDSYGQVVDRKKNPNDEFGPFFHQLRVFLIDREGMIRNIYSYDLLDPRLVITDVRTLLLEK